MELGDSGGENRPIPAGHGRHPHRAVEKETQKHWFWELSKSKHFHENPRSKLVLMTFFLGRCSVG